MKKRSKLSPALAVFLIFVFAKLFVSCLPGNPSEEGVKETRITGVLSLSAGGAPYLENEPASSRAAAPLVGYKLHCWTTTGPQIDGIGVSDSSGAVTVILKAKNPTFSCNIWDSTDKVVATLLFSDHTGNSGQKISASGDVPLGTITVSTAGGTATALIPSNATIVTGGGVPCESIPRTGLSSVPFSSDCASHGIILSDVLGSSGTVQIGSRFRVTGTYNIGPQSTSADLRLTFWANSDNCPQYNIASGSGSFDVLSQVYTVPMSNNELQLQICDNGQCNIICNITIGGP